MKICFCGDIMVGGMFHYKDRIVDETLNRYLYGNNICVGTLECAVGEDNFAFDDVKVKGRNNLIWAKSMDFAKLNQFGIDVVSLANNHIYDMGEEGLRNTIELCQISDIAHCGAGMNLEEARKPAVLYRNKKTIAFLAYCACGVESMGYVRFATHNSAGVAPLVSSIVYEDIRKAKSQYDKVIVIPHWGEEYEYLPTEECVEYAKMMIDAGADAVFGGHTHCVCPMIEYKGKPIYFSLGNFAFPDYYMRPPRPVFYPTENEPNSRHTFERVLGYPYPIYSPCVQVWPGKSRIGMIAVYDTETGKTRYDFTCLTPDNVVQFYFRLNRLLKRLRLRIMGSWIASKHYSLYRKAYYSPHNWPRKALHKVSDLLHINYDINVEYDRDCR